MKKTLFIFLLTIAISCNNLTKSEKDGLNDSMLAVKKDSFAIKTKNIPIYRYAKIFKINDSIFLLGKHPIDENIILLDNKQGITFETKTLGPKKIRDDFFGDLDLTAILLQPPHTKGENYEIVVFGPTSVNYKLINQEVENDKDLIKKIDDDIRKTDYLDSLLNKNGGLRYSSKNELKTALPILSKIILPKGELIIATYKILGNLNGPRLAVFQNKLIPLTGQCSFPKFYTFALNGKNYIQTGSSCCQCGIVADQLFEISNTSINLIFEDYSSSN